MNHGNRFWQHENLCVQTIYSGQKKKVNGPEVARYFFPVEGGILQLFYIPEFEIFLQCSQKISFRAETF